MTTDTVKPKKGKKTVEEALVALEETGVQLDKYSLGPWSHSKVKTLRNCPLKFYLQYILKAAPTTPPEKSLVTEVGKAAHRILELHLGGMKMDKAYSVTRKEFEVVLTDQEWEENLVTVEYNISKFKDKIDAFDRQHGVKRLLQELRIGCTKGWEPTGFFADDVYFRGVIDLAVQLNNGDLVVVDHKFGTVSAMGLRNFQDQLNVYKVLFHKGIEGINGAAAGIHHIREGEVVLDEYADKTRIEKELLPELEFTIQGAIDHVVEEQGAFVKKSHSGCKYCDYRAECKAGKFKALQQDSKKWFEIKRV